jgi:oligoribonuclease NrnB/cAMP/cGMP phosphodiesterase (DHH superfamily)
MSNWVEIVASKDLKPEEVDVVIYHNPCADGTTSGLIAWKYFKNKFPEKNVDYYPMTIGSSPPTGLEGKNVLICDYSYRKDVLLKLLTIVNKLLVIDHHDTAQKDLAPIDDKYKIFDMGYSGAMLTWFYFFPEVKPPLLVEYVQDRDIWTKKLPNIDAFSAWFNTLPLTFEEYDKYFDENLLLEMIKTKGIPYEELNNYYIDQAISYTIPKFCNIKGKYYFVAYVNGTICKSDIGNRIFNKFPLIDFSAVYSINEASDDTLFSLRSTEKHADVGSIAFSLGGGGHKAASGVRINYVTNKLPGIIHDNGKLYYELKNIYYDTLTINNKTYNVVLLSSSTNKTKLCKYLLQDKYSDNNKNIQVCKDISMQLGKEYPDDIQIALVWMYNPVYDVTKFSVAYKNVTQEEQNIINTCYSHDLYKGIIFKGFHKKLPLDTSLVVRG